MKVRIGVERFDPSKDESPYVQWFELDVEPRSTLLDALMQIESADPTISIPYSCRRGVCGSCAVLVNDVALPACSVTMSTVIECLGKEIVVKPLPLFPRLKDLVVDRSRALRVMDITRYWIHRLEPYIPPERVSKEDADRVSSYRKCSLCFSCVASCPVASVDKRFGGPVALRAIAERSADPRDALDRVPMAVASGLYNCLVCDTCSAVCPQEIDVGSAVVELRSRAWKAGLAPSKIRDALDGILDEEYGNPLWLPRADRNAWIEYLKPSSKAKVLLFAGCMASYVDRESAVALGKILEACGIRYTVLGSDELCCGMPLYLAGALEEARDVARRNTEIFRKLGVETVVTPCPSCYRMFKSLYPKLGVELENVEVVHAVQLVAELINKGVLRIDKRVDTAVTYHDPCDLGRHEGVFEEPRAVIEACAREFIEMRRRKMYAQCCGAGGNVRISNPELSIRIGVDRVRRDLPPGVTAIVHACPTCKVQLSEACQRVGIEVRNISIQELVLQCIRRSF
ncbi:MAG: 2Fe-2S iron-sulfur cluster binding domain-containing protein [Crenarchaeota archaeon]|nr:2Fe-2S iron-sulfur cluster binding domain-containing protein [Thermoproteota archaeon]